MNTMGRAGNPHDPQHPRHRVNQSIQRRNGKILLIAFGCAVLAISVISPVTLAQSDNKVDVTFGSELTPGDVDAIEAVVEAMPLSSTTVLDALSDNARAEVERICLPVQYQSGAVAYRDCISEQLDSQASTSTAVLPNTSLTFDEEFAIQQTCKDAGPLDSEAYRACDEAQLASLAGVPEPALYRVTEDETYAVQLGCYDSQTNDGVKAYRQCLNESIGQLLALPRPDLATLTLVERNALQLRCSAQTNSAVAYRKCLLDAAYGASEPNRTANSLVATPANQNEIERSLSVPAPELSPEISPELSPESSPVTVVELSDQTATQLDGAGTPEIATLPEISEPALDIVAAVATPVVELDPATTSQAIRLPTTGNSDSSEATESIASSETSEEAEESGQTPADLLTRVRTTVTGMNDMTRMLMWTAIGLPILLTLFWLLMRGRKSTPAEASYRENPTTKVVDTAPRRRSSTHQMRMTGDDDSAPHKSPARQQNSSTPISDDVDALNLTAQMDQLFGKSSPGASSAASKDTDENISGDPDIAAEVLQRAPPQEEIRPASKPVSNRESNAPEEPASIQESETAAVAASTQEPETAPEPTSSQEPESIAETTSASDVAADVDTDRPSLKTPAPELTALTDLTLLPATRRDEYLAWLSVQDETKQQTLAIEFLIYWMAYSDERYSPELKKDIFQLQNPGDHELIKRWTLKQDVHAFAGNLQWLQYNLSTEQHEQIINLLMALLVSENALTPAQNTLLRFLADAFGLGAKRLDALFQTGFEQPMPALPELDNPDWWKRQSADTLKRWDARSVSRQRSEIRYRIALGLPLGEELDSESIMANFDRAANRCLPERFDRLSSREQNLAAKQLEKYETAAESLLEVCA